MEKYNLEKLIKVEYSDFYPATWYTYKREIKIIGITIQKEGFYMPIWGNFIGFEIPENHTLKDNIIYVNPKVTLYYQNNFYKKYYFDSFEEAKAFADEITNLGKWL